MSYTNARHTGTPEDGRQNTLVQSVTIDSIEVGIDRGSTLFCHLVAELHGGTREKEVSHYSRKSTEMD